MIMMGIKLNFDASRMRVTLQKHVTSYKHHLIYVYMHTYVHPYRHMYIYA